MVLVVLHLLRQRAGGAWVHGQRVAFFMGRRVMNGSCMYLGLIMLAPDRPCQSGTVLCHTRPCQVKELRCQYTG